MRRMRRVPTPTVVAVFMIAASANTHTLLAQTPPVTPPPPPSAPPTIPTQAPPTQTLPPSVPRATTPTATVPRAEVPRAATPRAQMPTTSAPNGQNGTALPPGTMPRVQNALELCAANASCNAMLLGSTSARAALKADELRREVVVRTAIAITNRWPAPARDWVACVDAADSTVFAAIQSEITDVRSAKECAVTTPDPRTRSGITHMTSHKPGRIITVQSAPDGMGPFDARFAFSAGPRFGEAWVCHFERIGAAWKATRCDMEAAN